MPRAVAFAITVLLVALTSCTKSPAPPGPPVPGASVRLPDDVIPQAYAISLTPDLAHMTFAGAVTITIDVRRPVKALVLNALDLVIERASLDGGGPAKVGLDASAQTASFDFGRTIDPGRHTLAITYRGRIYTSSAGLFTLAYATPAGPRRMLVSQMESADARRVFPGWDQPDRKATFQLSVIAPAGQMAVSNMPQASVRALPDGLQQVAFQTTPKMSSYLLFLGLGDLERISRTVDGVDVGVVVRKGAAGNGRWALDRACELLKYYNDYFGIRYPLPKLDLVGAPGAGSFGAMENWGAILIFENRILDDPKLSTEDDRQNDTVYIAHEMAHQWFGDLVTMTWWNDLWLNESFAEWMEAKAIDHLHPDWRVGLAEASLREAALQLDSGPATHPVVQPAETLEQVEETGDAITYDKGAAVIRMLEAYVGEDAWQGGVRAFLREHAYGNASHADLWRAIEASAGRPVAGIAQDFTEQAGVPLVNAEIMVGEAPGSGLFLIESQLGGSGGSGRGWRIPVSARPVGGGASVQTMVRPGALVQALHSPRPGPLVVNPGQVGYFRTLYSMSAFAPLVQRLDRLEPADQLNLIQDGWALAQAGATRAGPFMTLADRLPASADPRVWSVALDAVNDIDRLYQDTPGQAAFRTWARRRLHPLMARVGWDGGPTSHDRFAVLRPALITALAELDDPAVLAEAARRYASFRRDPASLPAGLRGAVLGIAGRQADASAFDALRLRARSAPDPQEQRQYLLALAQAKDPAIAQKTLELSLSPEVPATLGPVMMRIVAARRPDLAWRFALAHRAELTPRLDPSQQISFMPRLLWTASDPARADELHAYAEKTYPPGGRREANRVEAGIRRNADVKSRCLPEIDRWLAAPDLALAPRSGEREGPARRAGG